MPKINIHKSGQEVAEAFANYLSEQIANAEIFHLALSGGSTPKLLFDHLAAVYGDKINWSKVHLYWGDERCVPPTDEESNYKMTWDRLIRKVNIPEANVHRVKGEDEPGLEAERYGAEIKNNIATVDKWPLFDLIILGMGADGHTASIFPHEMELMTAESICAVATHPTSGQKRISLTGEVIQAAKQIHFLVTGRAKKPVLEDIFNKIGGFEQYPAAHFPQAEWWLDEDAVEGMVIL